MGCLLDCVAHVSGVEVDGHDVGLVLSAVQEAPCLTGEAVDRGDAGGVDVVLQIGVQQLVGVELGAVAGHQVQFDPLGVLGEPPLHGLAAVDGVPVDDDANLAPGVRGEAFQEDAEHLRGELPREDGEPQGTPGGDRLGLLLPGPRGDRRLLLLQPGPHLRPAAGRSGGRDAAA